MTTPKLGSTANRTATVTTPGAVAKVESEVCEWLRSQGLLKPCPFERRLESQAKSKALRTLVDSLGWRYATSTLEDYEIYDERQRGVVARLRDFAAVMPEALKGGGGLMLFGAPGTGKDHLLAALLKLAVAMHGLEVVWYDGGALFDAIAKAARDEDAEALSRFQRRLMTPHVLAISDPQPPAGELSESQVRRVRDLIDRRYREGVSTWLTTNIDRREDAESLLTKPVMERLREGSGLVLCDWPSFRDRRKAAW